MAKKQLKKPVTSESSPEPKTLKEKIVKSWEDGLRGADEIAAEHGAKTRSVRWYLNRLGLVESTRKKNAKQ